MCIAHLSSTVVACSFYVVTQLHLCVLHACMCCNQEVIVQLAA